MKITNSIFSCGIALAISAGVVNAQENSEESAQLPVWMENVYLGGSIGATTSITDVKQYDLYPVQKYRNEIGFGGGGYLGYTINSAFSIEGQVYGFGINGTNRQDRQWFSGNILEPSLNVKINFTNLLFTGSKGQTKLSLHGYAGAGLAMFRSKRYRLGVGDPDIDKMNSAEGFNISTDEKKKRTQEISIPFGFQIAYELSSQVSLFLDQRLGFVKTDKLDATKTGNEAGEYYTYTSVGLNFKLADKKWLRPEAEMYDKLAQVDSILEGFKDTDQDGVMDTYDKDNKTPAGAKTTGDGMAMDTDGDGVADYIDQERLSVCTEVDENGVALDSDGDNVPDCKDSELNTEDGAQVDITGKTITAVSASTDNNSAADVGLPSIYFSTGSTKLGYENYPALTEVAKFLKKNKESKLRVVGHTDATGPEDLNKILGEKRAQAAIDHLVKIYGVDSSRLSAVSEGSSNGIALSDASRANRRVDFLIAK
mgnify:CR=1 FL=1